MQSSSAGGASVFTDAFKSAVDLFVADEKAFNVLADTPVNYHYNHPESNLYYATKPVLELRPLKIGTTVYGTLAEYLLAYETKRVSINENQATEAKIPPLTASDCLEKVNWGPPFLAPFTLDTASCEFETSGASSGDTLAKKLERWHCAASKLGALLNRQETMYERLMQPGECVVFDNTRILHGRRAFTAEDTGKPRWLRGAYVDKDPYLSKLRVLNYKLG